MLLCKTATTAYTFSILLALLNYGASDLLTVTIVTFPVVGLLIAFLMFADIPKHAEATFYVAASILALSIVWVTFQTAPLPAEFFAQPAWREVRSVVSGVVGTISVTPADDWASVLRIAAPVCVFLCGLFLFPTDERAVAALTAVSIIGGVFALGSIAQFTLTPHILLLGPKVAYQDSLTAPFINRNTAATFFGLLVIIECSMVQRAAGAIEFRRGIGRWQDRQTMSPDLKRQILRAGLFGLLLVLCLIALMLTKSRAGIASCFVSIVFLVLFMLNRPKNRRAGSGFKGGPRYGRKIFIVLAALLLVVLAFSMSGRALWRAEVQGLDDARFCVMPGIWAAIIDHFPQGAGLSSFRELFPAYRDFRCGVGRVWDKAHNVYLEGVLAFGLAFLLIGSLTIAWLIRIVVVGLRTRRRMRFGAEICAASLILLGLHSALDFSLQISGVAICLAAVLAPITTLCLHAPRGVARPVAPDSRAPASTLVS